MSIIAFCGAGGTGKTSTLNAFVEAHPDYGVIRSQSRASFVKHGVLTEDDQDSLGALKKWELQKSIQLAHWEYMQPFIGTKSIAERTQFDQLAYALQYCYNVIGPKEFKWLDELVTKARPCYERIFYFPLVEYPSVNDGMRTSHFGKRLQFDLLLQGILQDFKVRTITMPMGTVEERVEFLEIYLGVYGQRHL